MADRYTNLNTDTAILNDLTQFQGFYENVYRDPFIGGNAFVFVTRPMLFLDYQKPSSSDSTRTLAYRNMCRDPIFTQYLSEELLNSADEKIISMLSYNQDYFSSNYLPMFTNQCKSFDASDLTMEQMDAFDTKQGFREPLPTHKSASEAANSISISVTEDSNLDFTKLLTLWVNYISNITDGTFDANPEMVLNGMLDYTCAIFYFVLGPDGKTLKYWAKYTGCWPTTIPYSNFKYSKGSQDIIELDVNFAYTMKEDMSPKILEEFNIISLKLNDGSILPTTERYSLYSSISNSPLLNRNVMVEELAGRVENILEAETRDPLVFYVPESNVGLVTDKRSARFELIFDDNAYYSPLLYDVFEGGDQSYINDKATNFAGTGYNTSNWDQTNFWEEETIE